MHPNDAALADYIDGTLDASARAEIERHLEACAVCRRLVDDSREIKRVAASLELREPPLRSWTRLERAIKLEQPPARPSAGWLRRSQIGWLAAAAALVVATVVGLKVLPNGARQSAASE